MLIENKYEDKERQIFECKCGLITVCAEGHLDDITQGSNSLAAAVGFWIYPWTTKILTHVSIVHEEALTLQDATYSN